MIKKYYYIYSLILFGFFIITLLLVGFFKIGILSDTFADAYTAVNSTFIDKVTNNLEYIDSYRYRPVLFLTLKGIVGLNILLGISYDNFIIYSLVNLFLYLLFTFTLGFIVLKLTKSVKISIYSEFLILFYPNNLHNLCWSAAYFEILCGIFYLLAFLYVVKYLNSRHPRFLVYSNILFVFSLLTKEIAVTFPFVSILVLFILKNKKGFKDFKLIIISQLSLLVLYFVFKMFLSYGIPILSSKYIEGNFILNTFVIVLKSFVALTIPIDYSVLRLEIKEFNIFIIIYILIALIFITKIIINYVKQKNHKNILLICINFLILISPFIYAGYIRPQLILIPFAIILIILISLSENKIFIFNRLLFVIVLFWLFWSFRVVDNWKTISIDGKERIDNLLKINIPQHKKIMIIGNPARMQQYFIYDNIMFPYNYFKYKEFIIKDTIIDLVRAVALDNHSLNKEFNINKIKNNEYEIACTGKTQFFYLDGDEYRIKKENGISNKDLSVEILEYNNIGKPNKIKLVILNEKIEGYIYQGNNLVKLN